MLMRTTLFVPSNNEKKEELIWFKSVIGRRALSNSLKYLGHCGGSLCVRGSVF